MSHFVVCRDGLRINLDRFKFYYAVKNTITWSIIIADHARTPAHDPQPGESGFIVANGLTEQEANDYLNEIDQQVFAINPFAPSAEIDPLDPSTHELADPFA